MEELGRFVQPPHWEWYIIFYFFLGGIAGGAYATAGLLELTGRRDHPAVAIAHLLVQPLVIACGILLIIDLNSPLRFWHMLWDMTEGRPAFKLGSPISFGSWILTAIGALSFLSFVDVLGARGELPARLRRGPWGRGGRLFHRGPMGVVMALLSVVSGLLFASYTGLLLMATNQPVWSHTSFLGALFLVSGLSTGLAGLLVLGRWAESRENSGEKSIASLVRADVFILALEVVAIVAFLVSLGAVALPFLTSAYGILLVLGVLGLGVIVPLLLHTRPRRLHGGLLVPLLVLAGGFLLRVVIVLAPQA